MFTARHLMNPSPVVVGPRLHLSQVLHAMHTHHSDGAVVTAEGEVIGVITTYDLVLGPSGLRSDLVVDLLKRMPDTLGRLAEDVMTKPPHTVGLETPLNELLVSLYIHHWSLLPVLENFELVGVVNRNSVLSALHNGARTGHPSVFKR